MNPYLPSDHDPTVKRIPSKIGIMILQGMYISIPLLYLVFTLIIGMVIAHKTRNDFNSLPAFRASLSIGCHFVAFLISNVALITGCGVALNVLESMISERQWARRNFMNGTYYRTEFNSLEKER
jgi:hypothetical protein